MIDQRVAHARPVLGVVRQQRDPVAPRPERVAGRHAAGLLRALGEEHPIGREVPVPQAFVGAGHGERIALLGNAQRALRGAQRRARRLEPAQLAQHHRQQPERRQAQQRRAQHAAPRGLAPRREHEVGVARHRDVQRVARHGLRNADALDAVERAAKAARRRRAGKGSEPLGPGSDRLPDRLAAHRVAGDQRAVAVGQRDDVAVAELHVGIEALEVARVEQGADDAVEAAVGGVEALQHRQVPAVIAARAHDAVDDRAGLRVGLQPLERRPFGDVRRCVQRCGAARDARAVGAGDEDRRDVAQLRLLAPQVLALRSTVRGELTLSMRLGDFAEHHVDGLQRAARLLGKHVRERDDLLLGLPFGLAPRGPQIVRGAGDHRGDEQHARDGDPAPAPRMSIMRAARRRVR